MKLDLIDKKIICAMDDNCREPLQQLARRLRVSRMVVGYRLKRLEIEGIISNYLSSVNLGKLGYHTYKVYLKVHYSPEKEFIHFLQNSKPVLHAVKTEGEYDYTLAIATTSLKELDLFLSELKTRFKGLVKDYFVSLVVYTRVYKASKLLLGEKRLVPKMERYSGEESRVELDEKDKQILRVISQQANLSLVEIAKKAKISLDIVKYRLKQLNKNVIMAHRITVDFHKLGYHHYVLLLKARRATSEDEQKLLTWCAAKQSVLYCSKRIGLYDFEINVAIKDIEELNEFLEEMKAGFDEVIDSHELIIISKLVKLNYVPF
ncbi:MAG: Lrp/AsnC family transcriptional regulator [Candidatus Woesearchaeota archaeon]